MSFPSTFSSFTRPTANDRLNNPSHSALHNTVSSAVGQLEAVIGLNGNSSVAGTLTYMIESPDSNGGGHIQTANKGGTGQTSYTKGDILVAQSTSVLTKLAVGSDNQVLLANSSVSAGIAWGAVPTANVQSFLSSGTWVKPSAASPTSNVFIQVWGGGGGGGGTAGNGSAGGGGGGGYQQVMVPASILASSVLVNVGAGGTGGNQAGGTAGGISVFDPISSMVTAYAGGAGGGGPTGANHAGGGGAGVTVSGGDASGTNGGSSDAYGGVGGNSNAGSIVGVYLGAATGGGGGGGGGGAGNGGSAFMGGGGGGGVTSSVMGSAGNSRTGGVGTAGSILTNGSVAAGRTPSGGGGAAHGAGSTGGPGGGGKIIVTTFY